MANEEHLAILRKGVDAWNQWRLDNMWVRPDLRWAVLRETELSSANLRRARLRGADLRGANLTRAILESANLLTAALRGANFYNADLRVASLSGANLSGANLSGANLRGVNLIGADLRRANLNGADLTGANLTQANIGNTMIAGTIYGNTDLSKVKGIETVVHTGPSTIGVDTLYKSGAGNIPEEFLLNAGVPKNFIDYLPSLLGQPIQFYSCFISYSSKDEEFAQRLHADLRAAEVRVWFAPEDMKTGDRIRDRIDESIRIYDKLLIVLSEASVNSDWVDTEVETALEKEHNTKTEDNPRPTVLFPIRIDSTTEESKLPWVRKIRRERHITDFSAWKDHDKYKKALDKLLADLKASEPPPGKG